MKKICKLLLIGFSISLLFVSCEKKPLTLDENTSMNTLLKASDDDITALVVKEVTEKAQIPAEDVSVEYILRDEKSQTLVVKIKTERE